MSMQELDVDSFETLLSSHLDVYLTDEQLEFAKNFNKTMICFASPGTGKTMSAISGLLTAELYYRIPGENIYALSFTTAATGEIKARHEKACKKLKIRQTVNFNTLHSICAKILRENSRLLGMSNLRVIDNIPIKQLTSVVLETCQEWGLTVTEKQIPTIIRAVNSLNSALSFDRANVEASSAFKRSGISYEDFTRIRGLLFGYSSGVEQVQVQDIMLYTLLLLLRHPEVGSAFKAQCSVMLVDEAQDLSLLQLKIISLLANRVILIGDIKQQIYAFNGACQEIVEQFYKLYEDAETLQLTKSFRCKNEIADYATTLIEPNYKHEDNKEIVKFSGTGSGGIVDITNDLNLNSIVDQLSEYYFSNNHNFDKDVLFLFRNNASAIPVAEKLYKANLPFRVNKYAKAYEIPVIGDLTDLAVLAANPSLPDKIMILTKVITEFKQYKNIMQIPLYKIMMKTGLDIFSINYNYKNGMEAQEVFDTLIKAQELIQQGQALTHVFNTLWEMYYHHYLKFNEFYLEYKKEYYLGLVNELIRNKTLDEFIQDELKKDEKIEHCNSLHTGIRCYTMHASKGLEADMVYILDAEDGIIPNNNKLQRACQQGCEVEAARNLRGERNLVYVAATRAKEKLVVQYSQNLSPLFAPDHSYDTFDEVYLHSKHMETDIEEFKSFTDIYYLE